MYKYQDHLMMELIVALFFLHVVQAHSKPSVTNLVVNNTICEIETNLYPTNQAYWINNVTFIAMGVLICLIYGWRLWLQHKQTGKRDVEVGAQAELVPRQEVSVPVIRPKKGRKRQCSGIKLDKLSSRPPAFHDLSDVTPPLYRSDSYENPDCPLH